MGNIAVYSIYTASFPFLEKNKSKVRPVLLVGLPGGKYGLATILPISSQTQAETLDILIDDWAGSGLLKPSVIKSSRLTTILQSDLVGYLGTLAEGDVHKVQSMLRSYLKL